MAEEEKDQGINTLKEQKIRGEVVIGLVDPREMTEEAFNSSLKLLYHGAAREFEFSPLGTYDISNTGGDGSMDYGFGFYTTSDRRQAGNYSLVRARYRLEKPILYAFLPYKAKMLDVRDSGDMNFNGVLPADFVLDWLSYLGNCIDNLESLLEKEETNEFLKETFKGILRSSFTRVTSAVDQGKPITIRGDYANLGIFTSGANGLVDLAFRKFMLSKGYDGMIFREGGEGEEQRDLTGFVFYNCQVVDTWAGWQKREK